MKSKLIEHYVTPLGEDEARHHAHRYVAPEDVAERTNIWIQPPETGLNIPLGKLAPFMVLLRAELDAISRIPMAAGAAKREILVNHRYIQFFDEPEMWRQALCEKKCICFDSHPGDPKWAFRQGRAYQVTDYCRIPASRNDYLPLEGWLYGIALPLHKERLTSLRQCIPLATPDQ